MLNDLEVEQIAVGQGWQEDFLRPAAPSISSIPPASRNIQDLMRQQQARAGMAVPTVAPPAPARVPVPSPPPAAPARNLGAPAVAAPATVSKAAPPAPPAAPAPAAPAAAIDSIDSIAGPCEEPAPAQGVAVLNVAQQDDDNALLCAICQDLIREGDRVRKLRCPHSFHDECMEGWFRVTRDYTLRCPMRCVQLGFNII